jgi:hypothetical protein
MSSFASPPHCSYEFDSAIFRPKMVLSLEISTQVQMFEGKKALGFAKKLSQRQLIKPAMLNVLSLPEHDGGGHRSTYFGVTSTLTPDHLNLPRPESLMRCASLPVHRLLCNRNGLTRQFTVLAFESSADDTCAAVVTSERQILSNVVAKQHAE